MDNFMPIYKDERYTFNLSEEDKQLVINTMCSEFNLVFGKRMPQTEGFGDSFIVNSELSFTYNFIWNKFWNFQPTFSHIPSMLISLSKISDVSEIEHTEVHLICSKLCLKYLIFEDNKVSEQTSFLQTY